MREQADADMDERIISVKQEIASGSDGRPPVPVKEETVDPYSSDMPAGGIGYELLQIKTEGPHAHVALHDEKINRSDSDYKMNCSKEEDENSHMISSPTSTATVRKKRFRTCVEVRSDDDKEEEENTEEETNSYLEKTPASETDDSYSATDASLEQRKKKRQRKSGQYKLDKKCEKCSRCYKSEDALLNHRCKSFKHLCDQCGKQFNSVSQLRRHSDDFHGPNVVRLGRDLRRPAQCAQCGKMLHCARALESHMNMHSNKRDHICPKCGRAFVQKSNLVSHLRCVHEVLSSFVCAVCNKVFITKPALEVHVSQVHSSAAENTDLCIQQGYERGDDGGKDYACFLCPEVFPKMIRYLYHLKSHLNSQQTIPPDQKRRAENLLKEHEVHLRKSETFTCDTCPSVFYFKQDLITHKKTHSGVTYKCELCERVFYSKASRHDHQMTHKERFEFVCSVCGKPFIQERRLQLHQASKHGGAGTSDQTAQLSDLTSRDCSECGKSFTTWYNLKVHMRRHTKERPYVCPLCQRAFADPANLIHHGRRAHPNYPKTCFTTARNAKISDMPDRSGGLNAELSNPTV